VTCDLDSPNRPKLWFSLLKGRLLTGKKADKIYRTRRGFHITWSGLQISEEQSLRYRKLIGDDPKRILLDSMCKKKPKQILFDKKTITRLDNEGKISSQETTERELLNPCKHDKLLKVEGLLECLECGESVILYREGEKA
jgi:hypothetical protein